MSQSTTTSTFRPDIEGLRGIAILTVVLFHCGVPGFSGGFVGVDVFFVLSGYLITGLLLKEVQRTSRIDLVQFYARRLRRLLPASTVMILVVLLIGVLILAPAELTFAGRAARSATVYLSNVFFSINAADYFGPKVELNPILHTWSLSVEEQFYLFWPLLIMLGSQVFRSARALTVSMIVLTTLSFSLCIWSTANGSTFAFYELPARAWEFGAGGLVLPLGTCFTLSRGGWVILGWLGAAFILGSAHFISSSGFPGWIAMVPVLGTVAALLAGARLPGHGVGILLNSPPLQTLGKLSYSWYLWHWPLLVLANALYPGVSVAGKLCAVSLALGVALITHRFVENPIRFHPYLIARPIRSIYCGGAIMIVSLAATALAMRFAAQMSSNPELMKITASVNDIARMPRDECVTLGESPDVKTCVFGDPAATTAIVLFGDSHAIQWFNPLQRMAERHHWKLTTVVKSGCPAADIELPGASPRFTTACHQWRAEAIRRIVGLRPGAVFTASATIYVKRENEPTGKPGIALSQWQDATRRTLKAFSEAGLQVVAMRDNPRFDFDVPTCVARSIRHSWLSGGSCEMSQAAVLDPALFEAEKAAAQGLAGIYFIDLTDQFCPRNLCLSVRKGDIVYRDDNHLTGSFADTLLPVLEQRYLSVSGLPH